MIARLVLERLPEELILDDAGYFDAVEAAKHMGVTRRTALILGRKAGHKIRAKGQRRVQHLENPVVPVDEAFV